MGDTTPNYEGWTDHKWSIHAANQSGEALSRVGTIISTVNDLVADNRSLQSRLDRLQNEFNDLKETVGLLTGIILGD